MELQSSGSLHDSEKQSPLPTYDTHVACVKNKPLLIQATEICWMFVTTAQPVLTDIQPKQLEPRSHFTKYLRCILPMILIK